MAAPASPRGGFSAEDLAGLSDDERRKLLERNPHLAEVFERAGTPARRPAREPAPARTPAPSPAPAPAGAPAPPTTAAPARAKDRRPGSRPAGAGRRGASSRRLARRVARETPLIPGPSATSLLLTFAGSTLAVIGLVLLVEGGPAFGRLPAAIGTLAGRLTDPTDPIF